MVSAKNNKKKNGAVEAAALHKQTGRAPGVVDPMIVSPKKADAQIKMIDNQLDEYDEPEEYSEEPEQYESPEELLEEAGFTDEMEDEYDEPEEPTATLLEPEEEAEVEEEQMKRELDEEELEEPKKVKKSKKVKKKWSKKKKIIVGIVTALLLVIVAVVAYVFLLLGRTTSVFEGNPLDAIFGTELKKDENGRSNFLVFGTSEDEEGHSGALLTDSIMVVSMNQDQSDAKMFSVPRDLWVDYGLACSVGYQGKINATYLCALEANDNDQKTAAEYFANKVGEVFGMDIQYFVAVNWTVVRDVTDTLGGIDVDVYSDDPRGLYDINMNLNLPAGVNHLDGEQALKLVRARNAKGGYGLSRSNFDREKNQQRVIQAMLKQAGPGILTNPGQALDLIGSLGNNVKTNVSMGEARKVLEVAAGLDNGIQSLDTTKLFTTGGINGASVVIPVGATTANPFYYNGLRAWTAEQFGVSTQSQTNTVETTE